MLLESLELGRAYLPRPSTAQVVKNWGARKIEDVLGRIEYRLWATLFHRLGLGHLVSPVQNGRPRPIDPHQKIPAVGHI